MHIAESNLVMSFWLDAYQKKFHKLPSIQEIFLSADRFELFTV